jgi:hypothetical protein
MSCMLVEASFSLSTNYCATQVTSDDAAIGRRCNMHMGSVVCPGRYKGGARTDD